jgi:hypothetical protein
MNRLYLLIATALMALVTIPAASAGAPAASGSVSAGLGCAGQCITKAWVTSTMTGGSLQVETDTPARIKVWVSDQAPGFIDGMPWIPNPDYFGQTWDYTTRTFELDGLAAGTTHHILVTATDSDSRTAYRLGTFKTLDPPPLPPAVQGQMVRVTFFKVKILNDADKPGKGEILLSFLADDKLLYSTDSYMKLNSGQSYRPPLATHAVPIDGRRFHLRVSGVEHDGDDSSGIGNDHSEAVAVVDLDNLHDQVWDGNYGGMPFGHDAYLVFSSPNDDYLEFRVYAYLDIVSN